MLVAYILSISKENVNNLACGLTASEKKYQQSTLRSSWLIGVGRVGETCL